MQGMTAEVLVLAAASSQFPECGMNLCRSEAQASETARAELSQFPECGMNLCRSAYALHLGAAFDVSQFPECGMNLCRSASWLCERRLWSWCLNSLNAG